MRYLQIFMACLVLFAAIAGVGLALVSTLEVVAPYGVFAQLAAICVAASAFIVIVAAWNDSVN